VTLNPDIRYVSLNPAQTYPFAFKFLPACNLIKTYTFTLDGVDSESLPIWASLDTTSPVPDLVIYDSTTANAGLYGLKIKCKLNTIPLMHSALP